MNSATLRFLMLAVGLAALVTACGPKSLDRSELEAVALPALDSFAPDAKEALRTYHAELSKPELDDQALGEAWGRFGRLLDAHQLDDLAVVAYRNASRCQPDNPEWTYLTGLVELERADGEKAADAFADAASVAPEEPLVRLGQARAALLGGDDESARRHAQAALAVAPGLTAAWVLAGDAARAAGDHEAAVTAYETALRQQPGATRLHSMLAASQRALGRGEEAARHDAMAGDVPVSIDDRWLRAVVAERRDADWLRAEAIRAFEGGDLGRAFEGFREVLNRRPEDVEAWIGMGSTLARAQRPNEALEAFTRAATLAPGHPIVEFNLGVIAARRGDRKASVAHYRSALDADPSHAAARFNLANTLLRLGDPKGAEVEYRALLDREPGRAAAWQGLAAALADQGRWADAQAALSSGLETSPLDFGLRIATARLLAAAPAADLRNPARAVEIAEALVRDQPGSLSLEVAALAAAASGDYARAIERQVGALSTAGPSEPPSPLHQRLTEGLERYRNKEPLPVPRLD